MPTLNLKPQKLKCPFCSTISTRGAGLSAHVRFQHSREYRKWKTNPNRLIEAAEAVSPQPMRHPHSLELPANESEREAVQQLPQLPSDGFTGHAGENESHDALSLLQKAHQQLTTRKQTIESELTRIEGLRREHAAVTGQAAALDEAIKSFQNSSA